MIADGVTIGWKEWKEWLLMQGSSLRGGLAQLIIPIFLLGIFIPLQAGRDYVHKPMFLIAIAWMPAFMIAGLVADSFAGERERHTLETLLASRVSDRAILLGKFGAAVLYAWGIVVAGMLLSLVTLNIRYHDGPLIMFSAGMAISGPLIALLGAGAMAAAGILVSLHAATARQAAQRLMLTVMIVFFGLTFGFGSLPSELKARVIQAMLTFGLTKIVVLSCVVLFAVDVLLLLMANARFQRARLILD